MDDLVASVGQTMEAIGDTTGSHKATRKALLDCQDSLTKFVVDAAIPAFVQDGQIEAKTAAMDLDKIAGTILDEELTMRSARGNNLDG
jgi:hypothetical protein